MIRRAVFALAVAVTACGGVSNEITSPGQNGTIASRIDVTGLNVVVPRTLTTSEAHQYYPLVDIVWREDPPGDRYQQVQKIMTDSLNWGLAAFNRGQDVVVRVEVTKFHALSQKARYSVGGVHTIRFNVLIEDARTKAAIAGPFPVNADLREVGGAAALEAEALGRTQKVRITQHVAGTIQKELIARGFGTYMPANGS